MVGGRCGHTDVGLVGDQRVAGRVEGGQVDRCGRRGGPERRPRGPDPPDGPLLVVQRAVVPGLEVDTDTTGHQIGATVHPGLVGGIVDPDVSAHGPPDRTSPGCRCRRGIPAGCGVPAGRHRPRPCGRTPPAAAAAWPSPGPGGSGCGRRGTPPGRRRRRPGCTGPPAAVRLEGVAGKRGQVDQCGGAAAAQAEAAVEERGAQSHGDASGRTGRGRGPPRCRAGERWGRSGALQGHAGGESGGGTAPGGQRAPPIRSASAAVTS